MNLSRVSAGELAIAALTAVRQENGRIEGYLADDLTARLLGGSIDDAASLGVHPNVRRELTAAQRQWSGRVRRALDKLAREGLLVKVGNGQRIPGGGYARNTVYYYTPEEYRAAEARAEEGRARVKEEERRQADVRRRLWDGPAVHLAGTLSLSLTDWEKLLAQGGW